MKVAKIPKKTFIAFISAAIFFLISGGFLSYVLDKYNLRALATILMALALLVMFALFIMATITMIPYWKARLFEFSRPLKKTKKTQ